MGRKLKRYFFQGKLQIYRENDTEDIDLLENRTKKLMNEYISLPKLKE